MNKLIFPEDFIWGSATAAYQIEGASKEDGRGESIWDRFSHTHGKVENGDTGDVACDHYHRYKEDIELMKEIGLDAYRFSFSWPRILPEGHGKVNQKGLDFYKKLIDGLLEAGISPTATINHWDLPQALQDKGGWAERDIINYYTEYAQILFREFGDLVPRWITHNEPWMASFVGYAFGEHAPGLKDYQQALRAAHHLLLSHGLTVRAFRKEGIDGEIGITLNLVGTTPYSDAVEDIAAAERQKEFINGWFLDPLFKGKYPETMSAIYKKEKGWFDFDSTDFDVITEEMDFLGINYYNRLIVKDNPKADHILKKDVIKPEDSKYTDFPMEIYPQGLYDILMDVNKNYTDKPIYITENGAVFNDKVSDDGRVHDQRRIDFYRGHFSSAHQAIQDGVPLKGYYAWSLMDNFEWACGYTKRFGITYVDYKTQERILKDSAYWYSNVIKNNGIDIE